MEFVVPMDILLVVTKMPVCPKVLRDVQKDLRAYVAKQKQDKDNYGHGTHDLGDEKK